MKGFTLKDFLNKKAIQSDLDKLANTEKPTVVACGAYNHGKSFLLNSIMEVDAFSVSEKVETRTVQAREAHGICWVDTPGLFADITGGDDTQALQGIERADYLLLVHRVSMGELDLHEVDSFARLAERFEGRCTLVLTAREEVDSTELTRITQRIQSQLPDVPVVDVSSRSYRKACLKDKERLMAASNMGQLMQQINDSLERALEIREEEKRQLKAALLDDLNRQIRYCNNRQKRLKRKARKHQQAYQNELADFANEKVHKLAEAFF